MDVHFIQSSQICPRRVFAINDKPTYIGLDTKKTSVDMSHMEWQPASNQEQKNTRQNAVTIKIPILEG